ncbi:MAG: CehA/McbA family metallohydrolase [Planctomycetaceae bacterium]
MDDSTGEAIPARVYLQSESGEWLFVSSPSSDGSALPYREQWVPMPQSVEKHTTVSAHGFRIELPPGEYSLEIERGKEYLPLRRRIVISDQPANETFRLKRWINLAKRGWYSGETHVHRRLTELPNVMLAEDLNVAFPVTFWTIESDKAPSLAPSRLRRQGPSPFGPREDRGPAPIHVDPTHVILPRNTEYEIFSVDGKPHPLGAIFVLNHRSVFSNTAPPVAAIADQAHSEGALLDLDKHSWPWSMMLVPVAKVDLYELSNNSVWRTRFGLNQMPTSLPEWMHVERDGPNTLTEWGWLNYGFEMYYALLNCGFRLSPTAGTASGVHPVPLGYSRVYVHTGDRFEMDSWLKGLKAGRSFVTTGPMLFATVENTLPGETISFEADEPHTVEVEVESVSEKQVARMEILVNGQIAESVKSDGTQTPHGAWRANTRRRVTITDSCWMAVRSVEPQPDGRNRFAHTAPWFVSVARRPIAPRREQVEYFVSLMESEIIRSRNVLKAAALGEFEHALTTYRELLPRAK